MDLTFEKTQEIFDDNSKYLQEDLRMLEFKYKKKEEKIVLRHRSDVRELEYSFLPISPDIHDQHITPPKVDDYYPEYEVLDMREDPEYVKQRSKMDKTKNEELSRLKNSHFAKHIKDCKEKGAQARQKIKDIAATVIDDDLEVLTDPDTAIRLLYVLHKQSPEYSGSKNVIKKHPYDTVIDGINEKLVKDHGIELGYHHDSEDDNNLKPYFIYYGDNTPIVDINYLKSELSHVDEMSQVFADCNGTQDNYYFNYIDPSDRNYSCKVRYNNGNYTAYYSPDFTPADYTDDTTSDNLSDTLDIWFKKKRKENKK